MSVVDDIGQHNMDVVHCVYRSRGLTEEQASEALCDSIDFCMAHDQNVLLGICWACGDEATTEEYVARAKEEALGEYKRVAA